MNLWHFTCEHGHAGLGEAGTIGCNPHPLLPELGQLVWLTDDPDPARDDVGLTSSVFLTCDRMTHRYRVLSPSLCIPWMSVRHRVAPDVLRDLETFGAPDTWWISTKPIRAVLAQAIPAPMPAIECPHYSRSGGSAESSAPKGRV